MRISDWSSDVCSSDLTMFAPPWMTRSSPSDAGTREVVLTMLHESYVGVLRAQASGGCNGSTSFKPSTKSRSAIPNIAFHMSKRQGDRKRVVQGKSVSVRVAIGGRSIIKKKKKT